MSLPVRVCVAALSVLAAIASGPVNDVSARQAPSATEHQPGPTVDFVAVQADGAPVLDLQPSDAQIRIAGKSRSIRSLRLNVTAKPPSLDGASPSLPPPYGTNADVVSGRTFALVVDEASFPPGGEQPLRNAVNGLLPHLGSTDQSVIVALPFGGVKVQLTSDLLRVRSAMDKIGGQGSATETGSDMACRTRRFLDSLDGFLSSHAGRTAPLTVVLFTAGLAGPRRDKAMALGPGMCELAVDDFSRVTVAASAARANLYILQPANIGMTGSAWRETIAGANYLGSDNPLIGIEHLAGATGGTRLPLDATGTASLLRVARETSAFYVAELEPERNEVFGRARSLEVRALRRGVTVRARPEITFAQPLPHTAATRLTVPDLLLSREAFTDLPLRAAGFAVQEPNGRLRVGVVVESGNPAASLDSVGAALVDGDGHIAARWFAADSSARPLIGAMVAPPGTYRLRVAAMDSGGRPGAAEEVIEARLTPVGPLLLGSLLLGVSRDDEVAPRLEFGAEPSAIVTFDIYGGVAGMRISATMEVARALDGPALVTLPLALARADESRVVATGAAPIGALPPGDYVVRGVIRLEDGTMGRVTRTLRKVPRQD